MIDINLGKEMIRKKVVCCNRFTHYQAIWIL